MLESILAAAKANPLRFAALLLAGPPVALLTSPIWLGIAALAAPFLLPALLFVGVGLAQRCLLSHQHAPCGTLL